MYKDKSQFQKPIALITLEVSKYDSSFATLRVEFMYERESGDYRYFAENEHKYDLAFLSIEAHLSDCDYPYGNKALYRDVFSTDIRKARSMLKTLERIETVTSHIDNYTDFVGYLKAVFYAFKVDGLLTVSKQRHPTTYNEIALFHKHETSELENIIDTLVKRFMASQRP